MFRGEYLMFSDLQKLVIILVHIYKIKTQFENRNPEQSILHTLKKIKEKKELAIL
jgi:hypothetical protein